VVIPVDSFSQSVEYDARLQRWVVRNCPWPRDNLRKRNGVRTITVRRHAEHLSDEMAAMRAWLDSNGHEARRFNCDQDRDTVVLSVDFMDDAAADAFAARFQGESGSSQPLEQGAVAQLVK
jgi:hypothetical protein